MRSRTAWALTAFFASQSMQAYIAFGWFARFLHAHGISEARPAGWSRCCRRWASRSRWSRRACRSATIAPLLTVLGACFAIAYIGLGLAPVGGAWVWMVLAGIGSGMFPVALTMIGLRVAHRRRPPAALSAFVQAIGYIVAGTGPLLFGVLYGATGSWVLPLALLLVSLGARVDRRAARLRAPLRRRRDHRVGHRADRFRRSARARSEPAPSMVQTALISAGDA